MACYFVTKKGDNKVLDIGNLVSYSMHGNTKIAHVYHPVINSNVPGFCWWGVPEYEVHCIEDLYYWDALEKNEIPGDRDKEGEDMLQYYNNIKKAKLKYSKDVGVYS